MLRLRLGCNLVNLLGTLSITLLWRVVVVVVDMLLVVVVQEDF
jgi:hypothetical protein